MKAMKVVMIASEANPLCKTGGLADVVHALSRELNELGTETVIVLPYYKCIKERKDLKVTLLGSFDIFMSWRKQYAGVLMTVIDGLTYYLIDNEYYFKRENLYGYQDDGERFAFYSLAAIRALKLIGRPFDIIHVHDWQTGMIPCLLKEKHRNDSFFAGVKTVLTIHNPLFKGAFDKYYLNNFFGLSDDLFYSGKVRFDGLVSTLKSAITYSDVISTVSPTHRDELLSYGSPHRLHYALELRRDDFVGILNGIDTREFDPVHDPLIARNYNSKYFLKGKLENKKDLLKQFHLTYSDRPLYGLVSRLSFQKGIELIVKVIPELVARGASVALLGAGDQEYVDAFEDLHRRYPDRVGIFIGYNDMIAHKIYAGADFFLMPSLFEPGGIGQIIAQKYGTLPIVRSTGGLKDSVIGYLNDNVSVANGISFADYDLNGLRYALDLAEEIYARPSIMRTLIVNAMKLDNSWVRAAEQYISLYKKALLK